MSDKLRIPGPDPVENVGEMDTVVVLAWAVCMVACFGLFFVFRARQASPDHRGESAHSRDLPANVVDPRTLRHRQRGADDAEAGADDPVAAFNAGPRPVAEAACRKLTGALADATLPAKAQVALLRSVDRRALYAPWTCLLERYLAGGISTDLDIYAEMDQFWQQLQRFRMPPQIMLSVLDPIKRAQQVPDEPRFRSWLRRCGLHPVYPVKQQCREILALLAPAEGQDLLAVAETQLAARAARLAESSAPPSDGPPAQGQPGDSPDQPNQPDQPSRDSAGLVSVVRGVGRLAIHGQPSSWTVTDNTGIANYDRAFRIGATFLLCRFANSPDKAIAHPAVEALAAIANIDARGVDPNRLRRWRGTCGMVFRTKSDQKTDSAGALAVWNGQPDTPANYSLKWAQQRGDCPSDSTRPDSTRPDWYCGVQLWQGTGGESVEETLNQFFLKTRDVEWEDDTLNWP